MGILCFKGNQIISDCFIWSKPNTGFLYLGQAKENLQEAKDCADLVLNSRAKDIPDVGFLKIVSMCYRPAAKNYLSAVMNAKFQGAKEIEIKTDDTEVIVQSEGHGKKFSWWSVWKQYAYMAYANKNFPLEDRVYSKQEVADLAHKNIIDVIDKNPYVTTKIANEKLRQQKASSAKCQIETSFLADSDLFYKLHKMTKAELSKFCEENKFLVELFRSELTDKRLSGDFDIFPSLYEKGLERFQKAKSSITYELYKKRESLKDDIIESEKMISKSKEELKKIEEETAAIREL